MSKSLIPSSTIERICAQRDAALSTMQEAVTLMGQAQELAIKAQEMAAGAHGPSKFYLKDRTKDPAYRRLFEDIDVKHSMECYRKQVDANVWSHLLVLTGMQHLMDRTAKEQFDQDLSGDVPPVTVENVRATLEGFLGEGDLIFQRGLARAFSELDRRFKSHDAFKIGSRMVLTHVFDSWGSISYGSRMADVITDIERVFSVLDGKAEPPGGLVAKIREDRTQGRYCFGPRQSVTESAYFRVRGFKNGNAHLWFLRDDLVEKANKVLAEYYGEVLPDAMPGFQENKKDVQSKTGALSKDLAFYPTPQPVIDEILHAWRMKGLRVLEPSAGTGNIAEELVRRGALVDCIEVDEGRAAEIRRRVPSAQVTVGNFLQMAPQPVYDHVVMNPPFYGTHWMEHVVHAMDWLVPGGRLTAILPISAELGDTAKHESFRKWAQAYPRYKSGGLRFHDLPAESFASSGTRVSTCYIHLTKW